jgi:hypothetical protein
MITEQEIESLGQKLADLGDWSKDGGLLDHLDEHDTDLVLARAEIIAITRGNDGAALADSVESLIRLGKAAGCPDNEPMIPWLQERGLVEEVDGGGFRFRMAKPGAAT